MNLWFTHLPLDAQPDLGERFRSPDEQQYLPAFWELYLHELFLSLGFAVQLHPEVPTAPTNPDMLVERENDSFYVEAVAVLDKEAHRQSNQKRAVLYDKINEQVRNPDFFVDVETVTEGVQTPKVGVIAKRVGEWLATLDPDAITGPLRIGQVWTTPERALTFGDWSFRFRAIPKKADRRALRGPTVGLYGPSKGVIVNDHVTLEERLRAKSNRYGELDRPLLLALLYQRWTAREYHLLRALFDHAWEHPKMIRAGRVDPSWPDDASGLWLTKSGPSNRRSSAILCGIQVAPFWVNRANLWLIHNPWAQAPLTAPMPFATTTFSLEGGERINTEAERTAAEIFGLPEVWPPGEAFRRD
jgi:hypothetical protein